MTRPKRKVLFCEVLNSTYVMASCTDRELSEWTPERRWKSEVWTDIVMIFSSHFKAIFVSVTLGDSRGS